MQVHWARLLIKINGTALASFCKSVKDPRETLAESGAPVDCSTLTLQDLVPALPGNGEPDTGEG